MKTIKHLLDLINTLVESSSNKGCESDLCVVSAAALWDVKQAAKLLNAGFEATENQIAPLEQPTGTKSNMSVPQFQLIAERLLRHFYGLARNDTHLTDEIVVASCVDGGYRPFQVVTEHAQEADLDRIDITGAFGLPSKAQLTSDDEDALFDKNERYLESIVDGDLAKYDAIEIHGVCDLHDSTDPGGTCCEVNDEHPQFFSVYLHMKVGGIECVGDFSLHRWAANYAEEINQKTGYQICDFVSRFADTKMSA